jgi:4-aminobutyrate--pyruvate transaminase
MGAAGWRDRVAALQGWAFMTLTNAQARDVESLLHPYTNLKLLAETGPNILERGQGVFVYDGDGKDYLEAMSGLWCTALGWGEAELADTAAEQMKKLAFAHIFAGKSHDPAIALAEKLKEMAPFPTGKIFFANSGSEANDTQIKLPGMPPMRAASMRRRKSSPGAAAIMASLWRRPA